MDEKPRRRWFRFSLRTLFVVVAVVALTLWGGRVFLDWYYSFPLADEVARYNSNPANNQYPNADHPLSEDEVIAAIESQLSTLDATEHVRRIYSDIVRTRRLPRRATLEGFEVRSSSFLWAINLNVWTGEKSGYGMRIRETPIDQPDADSLNP